MQVRVVGILQIMLSPAEVGQMITDDYALKPGRIRLIASGHNDTYRIDADAGATYAFRLYGQAKSWIRTVSDLRFELDLLAHLQARGAPVSFPIERRRGGTLGSVSSTSETHHYALFSWCPGRPIDTKDLTPAEAASLGTALASVHVAADSFVTTHSRYSLDAGLLLDRSLERMRPVLEHAHPDDAGYIEDCAVRIRERLAGFDPGPSGWGVIHGDPQVLNCHFIPDGSVSFFDFDHCGFGWRAYDIAYCLRHTNAVDDHRGEAIRSAVLAGYRSVRPLSDAEYQLLPTLGQAAWIREGTATGQGLPPARLTRLLRDPYGPWEGK